MIRTRSTKQRRDGMNSYEAAWAEELDAIGSRWHFEAVKLRLAKNTWYTPDFFVITADRTAELHEVKGLWRDDARVKIKVAAEQYPEFAFIAVRKKRVRDGGGWSMERFKSSRALRPTSFEAAAEWARDRLRTLRGVKDLSDADYVRRNLESIANALDPATNPKL